MCRLTLHTVVNFTNILHTAFAPIYFCQKLQSQTDSKEKLWRTLSHKKAVHKILVKLTPGWLPAASAAQQVNPQIYLCQEKPNPSSWSHLDALVGFQSTIYWLERRRLPYYFPEKKLLDSSNYDTLSYMRTSSTLTNLESLSESLRTSSKAAALNWNRLKSNFPIMKRQLIFSTYSNTKDMVSYTKILVFGLCYNGIM